MINVRRSFRWIWALNVVVPFTLLLTSCMMPVRDNVIQSNQPRATADVNAEDLSALVAGNSAFAFELYQALRQGQGDNLFYSPYSISLALAMTYAGARGETAEQMASTLHYTLPQAQLHPAFNALDTTLASYAEGDAAEAAAQGEDAAQERFQINIANALWGQKDFSFLPEFLDLLAENYGAGLRLLDFIQETEAARQTINTWVSDQTQGRIQDLIAQGALTPADRLVLTNAIYFKAGWLFQFEEAQTQDAPFTLLDGSTVTVPMMSQMESYIYAAGDGYQAIALPYQGVDVSMLIILPDTDRFDEIETGLTPEFLAAVNDGLSLAQVRLSLPKFTFDSQFRLGQTLASLGMAGAFSDAADFSGMTGERNLFISDVIHKAFVAVDETGTEAAAATAVVMRATSALIDEPIEMMIDRPFLFLIRDDNTDAILFMGRLLNPA